MNAHVHYLREYQLIKYLPENTYSVCSGSDWFKLPDTYQIDTPTLNDCSPRSAAVNFQPRHTWHKWQNHNIVHVNHTQLIHTNTLKPVFNVQGTVPRGDTLWSRETLSERCTIFSMLRNLRQRDTCHIGTLSRIVWCPLTPPSFPSLCSTPLPFITLL